MIRNLHLLFLVLIMAASIKVLDALWTKYHAEYNKFPSSHHQLMAFAKAGGTPLKFLDACKYFEMRMDEKASSVKHKSASKAKKSKKIKSSKKKSSKHKTASKKNKNSKMKKKNRHRRNSSVPQLASEQSYKKPIDSPKTQTNKNDLIASLKKEKKAKKKSKDKKKSKNVKSK